MSLNFSTVFCDLDGTVIHQAEQFQEHLDDAAIPTPGAVDTINRWHSMGHKIILHTARPHLFSKEVKAWLKKNGIQYDIVLFDCGMGSRILINDSDPKDSNKITAYAVMLPRNGGFIGIEQSPNVQNLNKPIP
jgi:hydroxymethylpyrimidine pyrophosphatase-like HAD family hydrolase